MDRQHVLTAYARAWAHKDEQAIREDLARCWSDASVYVSPLTDLVRGVEALTGLILDFPVMFPGAAVEATGPWDIHHDVAYFTWRLTSTAPIRTLGRDFGRCLHGVDFVEFDPEGKIARINAFFGFGATAHDGHGVTARNGHAPARRRTGPVVDLDDAEEPQEQRQAAG
jgi:hypothetical protein